jgi:hypothetical protein
MQLGTRWTVGGATPDRLPPGFVLAVRDVEAQLAEVDTSQWRWTLTWLEGRPVAELDDGTVIRVDHAGLVSTTFDGSNPLDED